MGLIVKEKSLFSSLGWDEDISCEKCGLYKNCQNPKIKVCGNGNKGILNIGEAPGEEEDKIGKPWQGRAGRFLKRMYRKFGIDLFEDCWNINSVNCRPIDREGKNRKPTQLEINCCRERVLKVIEEKKPKLIILLGGVAVDCLISYRFSHGNGSITKWRGCVIPDRDFKAWVCPVFHPSYLIRQTSSEVAMTVWKQDLERAFSCLNKPFPDFGNEEIEIIDDLSVLNEIKDGYIAFDYETTGLKPYASGHRIVAVSVSTGEKTYSFWLPQKKKDRQPFLDLLANPKIGKIAHNMKFEDLWSVIRLRQPVVNWVWDTKIAAHILDDRQDITGLKFQVYVNFGIPDYDSVINPYLKAKDPKNANSFNKIDELISSLKAQNLLVYCGMDSLFTYKLAMKQMKELGYDLSS